MSVIRDLLQRRRRWFVENLPNVSDDFRHNERNDVLFTCPCCGYPTLTERAYYDICYLCNWEDDGQDDARADEVFGGPNKSYSLTQARHNFTRYLVMYEPDNDTRIGGGDSPIEREAKRTIVSAFDIMHATSDSAEIDTLWTGIREQRKILSNELDKRVGPYE